MTSAAGVWQSYVQAVGAVDKGVNYGLGAWGRVVAKRPVLTVVGSAIAALCLSAGLLLIGDLVETESDKLWVPQDSLWIKQENYLESRFGVTDRSLNFIFEDKAGGNVLTAEAIREMFVVYDAVNTIKTEESGTSYSFSSGICRKSATGVCRTDGILRYFSDNATEFETIAAQGNAALMETLSASRYPDGSSATAESSFVGVQRDANGVITSATGTIWRGAVSPDISSDLNSDWGADVEEFLEPGPALSTVKYYFGVPTSVDNAIAESVGGDIPLIAVAVVVICVFAAGALFVQDRVYSHVSLALLGILTVTLSISAGFGLSLYLGIPFTSISQILPFILLGIGVDDIFVLVRSVEEVDELEPNLPLPERFEKALNLGGMSITVTSLTNAAAFMFGSLTAIPAVRWFCWSAAIAIMLDWALQLTLFLGCFVLTERRIINSRYDCLCCFKIKRNKTMASSGIAPRKPVGLMSANKDSGLQALLNKYLLPALFHPVGKITISLVVVALAVMGAVGVGRLREGLPLGVLAPDDHYFRSFDDAANAFESSIGNAARLYFRNMDQSDPAIQKKMLMAYDQILTAEYISDLSPDRNWLTAFQEYAEQQAAGNVNGEGLVRQAVFYDLLDDFLDTQPIWKDEVYRENGADTGEIEVSAFLFFNTGNPSVEDDDGHDRKLVTEMLDIGKDVNNDVFSEENAATDQGSVAMVGSSFYKYLETNRIIFRELIYNLGFALLGITIVGLILLIHPVAVLIMLLCIVLVDLALFAEMWVFDIRLNTVSVVNLVMAVGLAVDYSMHILHTFLRKSGKSRQERVHGAMLEIGAAVLLGVLSTLLGVVVLAGSQSQIVRTFFQLLTGTVIFGGIVGLLFLPVLLSFIGPGPCLIKEEQEIVPETKEAEDRHQVVEDA